MARSGYVYAVYAGGGIGDHAFFTVKHELKEFVERKEWRSMVKDGRVLVYRYPDAGRYRFNASRPEGQRMAYEELWGSDEAGR